MEKKKVKEETRNGREEGETRDKRKEKMEKVKAIKKQLRLKEKSK